MPNPVADPFGALERLTGTKLAHRLVRLTMVAASLGFLLLRLSEYQHFRHKTLWAAESAIFLVLILAYATRPEPVARARGGWGMSALKGAFSITVEARKIVAHGPYRLVRHPIYTGEIITATAVALWRFSAVNLAVWALIITGQLVRAKLEERKLAASFPEYEEALKKSRWLWERQPSPTDTNYLRGPTGRARL